MAGELIHYEGPRALVGAVSALEWESPEPGSVPVELIDQAISDVRNIQPLKKIEPMLDGPESKALADKIAPIGAVIDPKIKGEDRRVWTAGLVKALSDLPPRTARYAADRAAHRPMKFLNEVHAAIREEAKGAETRAELALLRLQRMKRELMEGQRPALTESSTPIVWTQESVDAQNQWFAAAGLATRYEYDGAGGVKDIDARENNA
jgi:hypothetical protein